MQINIRKATINDAEAISAIWKTICDERIYTAVSKPFTPHQVKEYINTFTERECIYLAVANDSIIGFQSLDLWAKYTDSFNHVGTIGTFVLPEWRNKKVGYKLAESTFEFARCNKFEKLVIYVRSGNKKAQKFYKNLGFKPKGTLENHVKIDNEYEDEIFMELFL